MESKGRTQEQRSAATRQALVSAGRRLWAERGYAEVGTPEIAAAAGVAMYHQVADKADLFLAVAEAVEQDVLTRLVAAVDGSGAATPAAALRAAVEPWLSICVDPEVRQLLLLDAPSVLGWKKYRDIAQRYSLGVTEHLLVEAMDAGQLARQPSRALAHILIGALDEAAMVIATAEDRDQARAEVGEVLRRLFDGLLADPGPGP
jgi:AcrR family transcriptional regulator